MAHNLRLYSCSFQTTVRRRGKTSSSLSSSLSSSSSSRSFSPATSRRHRGGTWVDVNDEDDDDDDDNNNDDGDYEEVDEFSMAEVMQRKISYLHDGSETTEGRIGFFDWIFCYFYIDFINIIFSLIQ